MDKRSRRATLSCSRQSDRIEERPTLEQLLNRLDRLQTQRLLQELVENRPELIDDIDDIDEFVSLIDLPKPKTKQPSTRQSKIEISPFCSHVKRILRDGLKELEYGSEEDPFTDDLLAVIEKARELAENGDGNNAIASSGRSAPSQFSKLLPKLMPKNGTSC
ncbi:hypothetical protein [Nostoc sp. CALU 1950]|uniref:hypothetical protein n=1 Tax=Nostoc sp. CALU 1950 TaxID=3104321 RepID=UPI003EB91703